jgi:cobaltochelatase CobT
MLRATRHDQAAYAAPAARIAERVGAILSAIEEMPGKDRDEQDDSRKRGLSLWLGEDRDAGDEHAVAGAGQSRLLEDGTSAYQVFTRAYDQEVDAAELVRPALLRELREQLDQSVARAGINVGRLARHLQGLFAVPTDDGWDSAQEEGRIDGRLLAQLVASPTERRLFRQVRREPVADCAVGFLLDCSGSMKQHAPRVSVLVDVFVRALEQAGIATEVLGFTTGAWNGGRARRDWSRAGSPAHPGRLNEVLHLVFKSGEQSWRRRRQALAALLKNDFYREGVDGEAVSWACGRLRARGERRRILVVVSDGSPMDGATALANDEHYLDHHLQDVVAAESARGDIAIRGLGVGLDLSPYYEKSRVLDLSDGAALRVFLEVAQLLSSR